LEAYSKSRTADAITALSKLRPVEALVVLPKSIKKDSMYRPSDCDLEKGDESDTDEILRGVDILRVDVDLLEVGDIVRVQNGATPPADGILIPGQESAFDESSLTGESKLVQKQAGDQVFVGTINKSKPVDVRVLAIGGETM
jgi:P-type Cu+ transporter